MALVLRDDIAKTLFRFGKRVEKEIREGNKLNILELNNLLRPTLETIESKAVSFATKEVEENIAKNHDNTRKRKREKICERRRATLSEKVLLETPMKRARIDRRLASKIQKLDGAVSYDPTEELDCLSDDDVLKYDTDDQSWDEYLPEVHIDCDGEYNLCAGDLGELIEYLDDNAKTVEEMLTILKSVKKKEILTYGYFLPGMIQLCDLLIRKKSDPSDEELQCFECLEWGHTIMVCPRLGRVLSHGPEDTGNEENHEDLGENSDTSTESLTGTSTESSEDTEIVIE